MMMRALLLMVFGQIIACLIGCEQSLPSAESADDEDRVADGREDDDDDDDEDDDEDSGDPDNLPAGFGKLAIGGIAKLPGVTEPVALAEDAETSEFDAASGSLTIDQSFALAATTGIALGGETIDSDFRGKSYAACRMVNRVRGILHMAATSDAIDCELRFILGDSAAFYDGNTHVFEITDDADGETTTEKYQIKIDGSRDSVKGYTVHRCENGSQNLYLKKTVGEDNKATIISKRVAEPDNPQVDKFWGRTEVRGAVDADGKFKGVKIIEQAYSNKFSDGSLSFVKEEVRQSSRNFQYTGYMSQSNKSSKDKFVAYHQLIDNNTENNFSLENYLIGDGAMAFFTDGATTRVQGWRGDTKAVHNVATDAYVARILASRDKMPAAPEAVTIKYEGSEVFDCDTPAEISIDDSDLYAAFLEAMSLRLKLREGESRADGGTSDDDDEAEDFCTEYQLPQDAHLECRDADETSI